jgi:CHAT domain-containing protein
MRRTHRWASMPWPFVVVLALVAASLGCRRDRPPPVPELLRVRFTEARLPVAQDHRLCRTTTEPGRVLPRVDCGTSGGAVLVVEAARAARDHIAAGKGGDPTLRAHLLLLLRRPDQAVEWLRSVGDSTDVAMAALPAALYEQGLEEDDPFLLAMALDRLEVLASSRAATPAERFNRALILTRLNLRAPAVAAWDEFIRKESFSAWSDEARQWLRELAEPSPARRFIEARDELLAWIRQGGPKPASWPEVAAAHPQQVRILLEEEGLEAWSQAVLDRAEMGAIMRRLQDLAALVARAGGGDLLLETLEINGTCARTGSCVALAAAHRDYSAGRRQHEAQQYGAAGALFARAETRFVESGSPFAFWPRYYRGVIVHHHPDFPAAERIFTRLLEDVPESERVVRGYLHWMRAETLSRRAEYGRAMLEFQRARDHFQISGERENEMAMEAALGRVWDRLDRPHRAWRHHAKALALSGWSLKSRRLQSVLNAPAASLRANGATAAALVFQEEALAEARRSESSLSLALALQYRAHTLRALGRTEDALADVREGLDHCARIADPRLRADPEMHLRLTLASLLRADPERARVAAEAALHFGRERAIGVLLLDAYVLAAELASAQGDLPRRSALWREAAEEAERQREQQAVPELQVAFGSRVRMVLERGVSDLLDEGQWEPALEYAERLRSRVLWRRTKAAAISDKDLAARGQDREVLSYLFLDRHRLVVWWVREGQLRGFVRSLDSDWLERAVGEHTAALAGGDGERARTIGRSLASAVLGPFLEDVGRSGRVIVVPDGPLHRLQFAALVDRQGRYLLERSAFSVAPSAAAAVATATRSAEHAPPTSLLLVGAVEHSAQEFPELIAPASIGRLTRRLDDQWPSLSVLAGRSATPESFLAAYPDHDVLLYAGHAVAPGRLSARSGLVLAPGEEGEGLLSTERLIAEAAGRTRLAILAGCSTGAGSPQALDNSSSVAFGFLAAGVPAVIATLWEIDDGLAADVVGRLAERIRRGDREPLRAVQLEMLRDGGDRRTAWSAFQAFGEGG